MILARTKFVITYLILLMIVSLILVVCLSRIIMEDKEYYYYIPSLAYFAFLTLAKIHMMIVTVREIRHQNEPVTIENFLSQVSPRNHFYVNTSINQAFGILLCGVAIKYSGYICFCNYSSAFFLIAYFTCHYTFFINSYVLLKCQKTRKAISILLTVGYYLQILIIFFSYIFGLNTASMSETQQALAIFLIYNLCYHLFILTPVFLIVCIFVFLQFLKVCYISVTVLQQGCDTGDKVLLVCLIILSVSYKLRIIYIIYTMGRTLILCEEQPNHVPPSDRNEAEPAVDKRNYLNDHEIQNLKVESLHSIVMVSEEGQPQQKRLPQILCTVCDSDIGKSEKIMTLICKHTFHQHCLVPWLKVKNSCPNCRSEIITIL